MRRFILITLAVILLTASATVAWLGGTQSGLDFVLARLRPILPSSIDIGDVRGRLFGTLYVQRFTLHTRNVDLQAGPARIDWHPLALLAGTVSVAGLDLEKAEVAIHPAPGESQDNAPFRLPERLELPVQIRLQRAALHHVTIRAPGLKQPLSIEHAALAGAMDTRGITIRTLEAHGPQLDISAQGKLGPARPYAATLHAEWNIRAPGWPTLAGKAEASGTLERRFSVTLTQATPFALSLDGNAHGLFGTPEWQARLQFKNLDPSQLQQHWPALTGDGDLALSGRGLAADITGRLSVTRNNFGGASAHVDMHLDRQALTLKSATLQSAQLPTELTLSGSLAFNETLDYQAKGNWKTLAWPPAEPTVYSQQGSISVNGTRQETAFRLDGALGHGRITARGKLASLAATPQLDARLQWQDMQWPLAGTAVIASPKGNASLHGSLQHYRFHLDGAVKQSDLPPGKLQLAGHGTADSVTLRSMQADWLGGHVDGKGRVNWHERLRWQASASLHQLNPSRLLADYPGKVNAELSANGEGRDWRMDVPTLGGTLRAKALNGSGTVARRAGIWHFKKLQLSVGDAQASVDGQLGPSRDLNWQVNVPQLSTLATGLQGGVHGQGEIQGHGEQTQLQGSLRADKLAWQNLTLEQLEASASVDANGRADIRIDGKTLDLPNSQFDTLQVKLAGDLNEHSLTVMAGGPDAHLNLVAHGGYRDAQWVGRLDFLMLTLPEFGNWHLRSRPSLRFAADRFQLGQACVNHDATRLCGDGHWQAGGTWGGTLDLTQLPLEAFTGFLPRGLRYRGTVNGHADISGNQHGPTGGHLDFKLGDGEIAQKVNDQVLALLDWKEGFLHASLENDRWEGEVYFGLADGGRLDIDGDVQPAFLGQPPHRIRAHVIASANDFGLVPVLIPELGQFSGKLNADFTVNGTLAEPTAQGTIHFTDGLATIPRLGLKLQKVNATLAGTGPGVKLTGEAQSGDAGKLDWDFSLTRRHHQWQGNGHIGGDRFQAMNIPEASVYVTPDLNVSVNDHKVDVEGSLRVPQAKLQPRDFSNAVQPSADQIIVTETGVPADRTPNWQISARVRTILGDKVRFEGFGLSGRITGELTAVDQPNQLTTGQGELRVVDGEYEAYGQKLTIENGRLIFNGGPITEPGLDITATRQVQDVKVGANVRGTLKSPKLTLFSDPSMPDSEVLSYLVIGRPLNQTSTAEQQKLSSASSQLGIAGGALLAGKLGRELGIEEVSVQSQAPGQAALVLGKYLSPRLYVSYGIGLFQSVNTVNLRYTLNSKWTLEAQSGEYSSADLLYTIETGE